MVSTLPIKGSWSTVRLTDLQASMTDFCMPSSKRVFSREEALLSLVASSGSPAYQSEPPTLTGLAGGAPSPGLPGLPGANLIEKPGFAGPSKRLFQSCGETWAAAGSVESKNDARRTRRIIGVGPTVANS